MSVCVGQNSFLVVYSEEVSSGQLGIQAITDQKAFDLVQVNLSLVSTFYTDSYVNPKCLIGYSISKSYAFENFALEPIVKVLMLTDNFMDSLCPLGTYNLSYVLINSTVQLFADNYEFTSGKINFIKSS